MSEGTDSNRANGGRDPRGRYAPGGPGGPGNPQLRQLAAHQQAIREALTPAQVQAVVRKLAQLALTGDVGAARVLLERVGGRAREEPPLPCDIQLGTMHDAKSCGLAVNAVMMAVRNGTVDSTTARLLVDGIATRLKSIEVAELEARIVELEKAAGTVDRDGLRDTQRWRH